MASRGRASSGRLSSIGGKGRSSTRVTFHNGVHTIGGTIVEVAYGDARILFDFGSEFNPAACVHPTTLQGLIEAHLAPDLPGVYDPRLPGARPAGAGDRFEHEAVFISHAHLDHTIMLNFINPDIPLYMSSITKSVVEAMNMHGDFLFSRYGWNDVQGDDESGLGDAPRGNVSSSDVPCSATRPILAVDFGSTIRVGQIAVTVLPIDHDAYGAAGFIIDTPDYRIAYTGDVRFHGYRQEQTLRFIASARGADMLITEGVCVSNFEHNAPDEPTGSELDVIRGFSRVQESNPHRQITFDYYPTNLERIRQIVETSPRTVVLTAMGAAVVQETLGLSVPYYRLGDEREYPLPHSLEVPAEDLFADAGSYLWELGNAARRRLTDLRPGGVCIHSGATPLGTYDPAYAPFCQRFADAGIRLESINCSGHMATPDLWRLIAQIRPRLLCPVHTLRPDRFENPFGELMLPHKGQTVQPLGGKE